MRPPKDHRPGCPRLQFWDAGDWQVPCTCPPRLRLLVALTLAGLLILILSLVWPVKSQAQELEPGVGLPGVPREDFSRYWCGQTGGGCTELAPEGFDCSLCPDHGWRGFFAEFIQYTREMLTGCWEADAWGTRNTHDGIYTESEFSWAQVHLPKAHAWYHDCWYARTHPGGSPDFPLLIDEEDDWPFAQREAKRQGRWQEGVFSYLGFDPTGARTRHQRPGWTDGQAGSWAVWVDNRLETEPPPPPEPPAPEPDPEPEPEPEPDRPECSPACRELAASVERALDGPRRVILPDGRGEECEGEEGCRWQFIASWLRGRLDRLAGLCSEERDCFVPGLPSTGRLEIEKVEGERP